MYVNGPHEFPGPARRPRPRRALIKHSQCKHLNGGVENKRNASRELMATLITKSSGVRHNTLIVICCARAAGALLVARFCR
ncbi:hypothetical protein EVAR_59880_1 [Eumeta japonica]|uniref:Uncharacterized protein n=1 Tax=Eumeta variegata TaxID=151549 RepID=A0A4C1XQ68_EUMVA|nr:hypothetical protein EVAR_59880_1 [Eumeta japonica]